MILFFVNEKMGPGCPGWATLVCYKLGVAGIKVPLGMKKELMGMTELLVLALK